MSPAELIKRGDYLFGKKQAIDGLWQTIADNFYPQRADFTNVREMGQSFAEHLTTSTPVLAARDLSNQLGPMLRRGEWFKVGAEGISLDDEAASPARMWLQHATNTQYKAMYSRKAQLKRATSEGDRDYITFGQCAISIETSPFQDLLYRCHHLRDMAWVEDAFGQINEVHRKWKPTISVLNKVFPKTIHPNIKRRLDKNPHDEVDCRHTVMLAEDYDGPETFNTPYVSVYLDVNNKHKLEVVGIYHKFYIIPRWETVSGSQYAHSPATIVGLPDGRMIQDMAHVLLTAGEKAVDPPMIAQHDVLQGGVNAYAGGLTYLDQNYDERFGEGLRPLQTDIRGIPLGMDMMLQAEKVLAETFYLNKLTLPLQGEMTAYETEQRVKEYIRQALPLFEPMEQEYNAQLCEETFKILFRLGRFGPEQEIPEELSSREIEWEFISPIRDAEDREKVGKFTEAVQILSGAAQADPGVMSEINLSKAARSALHGIDVPEEWLRDPEQAQAAREQLMQVAAQQQGV